jgi:hypothetical protein
MPTKNGAPSIVLPVLIIIYVLFAPVFSWGGEFYKWIDEEGSAHITDNLSLVPPQYQSQFEKKIQQMKASSDEAARQNANFERSIQSAAGLKHFEVPYVAFEGASRRIIIPVTFNESIEARLLLDTGSPGLMISPKLAGRLGLLNGEEDGNVKIQAAGIGGSVSAVLAVVDSIRVGSARSEFLPAVIAKIPSDAFEGLVGMDFMAHYRIGIDTNRNVVIFNELAPQVDRPGGHDEIWWRSNFQYFAHLRAESAKQIDDLEIGNGMSSEKEKRLIAAKKQHDAADELCRKLERYARENAVPTGWRR